MGKELFNPHLNKFSIRKLNVGVCSVLLSTVFLLGTAATVNADETASGTVDDNISLPEKLTESAVSQPVSQPALENTATSAVPETANSEASADQNQLVSPVAASEQATPEKAQEANQTAETSNEARPAEASRTRSYSVQYTPKPSSAAMPRSERNGQPMETGTSFRTASPAGQASSAIQDATPNPTVSKPTLEESVRKRSDELMKQVNWLDFGDTKSLRNLDKDGSFKVGTVYEKEISPGYVVKLTVTELKPFYATEIYRDRVKGTEYESSYDPNAKNTWLQYNNSNNYAYQYWYGDDYRPKITGAAQNQYSAIKSEGIDTKGRKTQLQVPKDEANYGVKFKVEARYRGKPVKATVVMADGEEANPGEYAIFTTNGKGWEHLAEWKRTVTDANGVTTEITETYKPMKPTTEGQFIGNDGTGVHWQAYVSPDQKTGGLGSQVFGPNVSRNNTIPLVMTRGASEVGIYIASSGQQAAMIGFMAIDEGDAPDSYGKAIHAISRYNAETGGQNPQPFLGRVAADIDTTSGNNWKHDDQNDLADEGINQLLSDDLVGKTNGLFPVNRLHDGDYSLRIHASANGYEKAYVRAWIDFNNNGVFDEDEASEFTEVTTAGDYTVNFKKNPAMTNPELSKLGMRVRIALNKGDIEKPTGTAFSGEVEDLEVELTYPPKGEKKESTGIRDQRQTATLHFTPQGIAQNTENKKVAIDTTKAPIVLDARGNALTADAEGWYNTAEGRYKVTANGADVDVVYEPKAGFIGTAQGINIRRFDTNGASTDWIAKNQAEPVINDQLNTMDGRYVPTVLNVPKYETTDAQGLTQEKTPIFNDGDARKTPASPTAANPVKFVKADGTTTDDTRVPALSNGQEVGRFEVQPATGKITFKPNKNFVGTVDSVSVQMIDGKGIPHQAVYQPKVIPVRPTAQGASSEGIQGAVQTGQLSFNPGNNRVPIDSKKLPIFDNGSQTKTVDGVGTYQVDNQGLVTFTPLPTYTGRPAAETIKQLDVNGTEVTATYQADVKAATPSATNAETSGIQGQVQRGKVSFTEGSAQVNGQKQTVTFPAGSTPLFDNGSTVKEVPTVGKFEVDGDGNVTFTPEKQFKGLTPDIRITRTDTNGSTATAIYKATVTAVTPTGTNITSTGKQGRPQTGKPNFVSGNPDVPMDNDTPATFDDGSKRKVVPNVGIFEVAPDGSVTFTPDKQYVGTPDPVTVKRVDKNGTPVTAKYTPTVEKVTPRATGAQTKGPQGQVQKGKVTFEPGSPQVGFPKNSTPVFDTGTNVKEIAKVGKFEVDAEGNVTFTPINTFVGKTPEVELSRTDVNGTVAKAKYRATVTAVTPTGTGDQTEGPQGQVQKGRVTFKAGDPKVGFPANSTPVFDTGTNVKEIAKVGRFEVDAEGNVTFTPDKQFKGETPEISISRKDENGIAAKVTYIATVTSVTPMGTNVTSTGPQGIPQTGTPTFQGGDPLVPIDEAVEPTFEDGSKKKDIPGQGTYTITLEGAVTFMPEKQFVGKPDSITVKRVDKNGTPVTATYSPEFTKVTPTGTGDKTEGLQGQIQEGHVTFTPGHASVPFPAETTPLFDNGLTVKEIPTVGKFEVDANGKVTFTPDKQFKGTTPELTLVRADVNGTPVTVKYQAVVKEVVPTGTNITSTGEQGRPQTGKPNFVSGTPGVPLDNDTPATFDDGSKRKVVPNVGIFEVAPDGSVTFTPDKQYVGTPDPVVVKRVDKNGTPVTAKYTPTVEKVTPRATGAQTKGPQGQVQKGKVTFEAGSPQVGFPTDSTPVFDTGTNVKEISKVGKFEVDADGNVTFTPVKSFVGKTPEVELSRTDVNGTAAKANYQATVTAVTPTGTGDKTEGLQGQVQKGHVAFTPGHELVPFPAGSTPLFGNGKNIKEVPNIGKFEVDADGTVTFTPDKQFKGETPELGIIRVDANGTPVTVKYQAVVKEVTPTATTVTSTGPQGIPQTGTPIFKAADPLVPIDETVEPTFADGSKEKTIPGQGTYTITPDDVVTFTPEKQFVGTPDPITVKRVDKNGTPVTATYSPEFTKVTPTGTDATSTGPQGRPQTGTPTFEGGDPLVPIDDTVDPTFADGSKEKNIPGQGTYTITPDGAVTFTPDKQFVGKPDPVTVKRMDKNGTPVTATYSPEFTKVTPTGTGTKTEGLQGQVQEGHVSFTPGHDSVPFPAGSTPLFDNGTAVKEVPNVGKFEVDADGKVTFTPDKPFKGETPELELTRVDANGTPVTVKYQAVVREVTPTATTSTSTGPQGRPQTGKPNFVGGDPNVPLDNDTPATFDDGSKRKEVPNVGTFEVAPDGSVTFTPDKQFVGTPDPVVVKRVDKNGTPVTAKYTPTVEKVTPTAKGDQTEGLQGQVQKGKVTFEPGSPQVGFPENSSPVFDTGTNVKEIAKVGKLEVDMEGNVTFTPVKTFVGKTPEIELSRADVNGTVAKANYQATVTAVIPTGTGAKTEGLQGQVQEGKVSFTPGHDSVPFPADSTPLFDNGKTVKEMPNVGKFEVDADGKVTFTPDKQFKGETPELELTRVDANGTSVTVKYQAVVKEVTPIGTTSTSTGPQGRPQTGKPNFVGGDPNVPLDNDTPATFDDGSKRKEVPNVGIFEVTPDGSVTFTPDKQFVGTPDPVVVKRVDKNGTPVTAKYTPTVEKVTPIGTTATSTGPQGLPQTGTPTFAGGDPLVPIDETVEPSFDDGSKEKTIPGQGTYTITPDGSVTFTPDKQFVGTPDPITVKRVDKNGTPVTATYSPEFTKVTPTGTGTKTEGLQGQVQEGKVTFTPGHDSVPFPAGSTPLFDNGSTVKEVPNIGMFEVDADGKVTFTPDKQFKGETPELELTRTDVNGTSVTVKYQAVVKEVTPTGTTATSTGPQGLPQTGTPTFKGADPLVPIDETVEPTFADGSKKKTIPGQGTYTITPDGAVTFTPDKQFVGTPDPITVKRVDKNGTPVTATYSPEFTKVTPTGTGTKTEGLQGQVQKGQVTFTPGHKLVPFPAGSTPLFGNGKNIKEVPNVGKFEVDADNKVTFTPIKQFKGETSEQGLIRLDANGTPVIVKYQAIVKAVVPTGKDASSTNIKGHVQTGKPVFEAGDPLVPIDETIAPTFEDGSKEKTIPGQGTYTIAPDGTVTFTPEADFLGKGTGVTLVRRDKNGSSVTARYVPTVVEPSTSKDSVSSGRKGQAQTGTPTFEGAIDQAVAPTFADGSTEMVVPGEGTYRFNMLGAVTFVPEADFVGTARGVVVKRIDIYGNAVTATYTPTVLGSTATEDTGSTGLKGQPQTGKPIFEGDIDPTVPPTFEDGSTKKVVLGQGTYTIAPDGTVTFVPETGFVGQADGVTVIRKDRNGQTISAVYIPTVTENPVQPERTITPAPPSLSKSAGAKSLPKTGTEETSYLAASLLAGVSGLGLIGLEKRKKKSED
ncbi:CshA/CshB family fibrillar adhesin-related protein [Streptococcus sanguinis]|uniref:CshA-like fibrillar surface protein A n=1 Tax=Streptococcus sanguinis TaxID=1305 RepID=A0A2X3V5J6_STRSA|nr:CshA/CshB family fibrillar adhesin-related protein [Streptococcus sanguinis]EGJ44202.1 CshA family fibrillar surface protein A [Streptococcus sanguinis SK1059]EGQ20318.1 CshA family fibrillar surface protein A [Streptococcus sanguinis ATCC 29667]EGQ23945.1 CshA family fibrillar surface protein A [Streptococcus sanguinis SK340]SQF34528.1 CshA-like fibrillar surface protein A [Streptococcus sanguinis]